VLGAETAGQVPVSDLAEILRSQIRTAASLPNAQQSAIASSASTLAGLLQTATATSTSVQQSSSSCEQAVVTTILKFPNVDHGGGDGSGVAPGSVASQVVPFAPLPTSSGDTSKPVGVDSASCGSVSSTFQTTSLSVPQSQLVVTCSSVSAGSSVSTAQPTAAHSSLPLKTVESVSLPAAHESHPSVKSVTENTLLSSAVSSDPQSNISSSGGNLSSFTAPGGFAPVFGNLNPTVSSSLSSSGTVQQQPAVSSNPVSFGGFAYQPSLSFSANASCQPSVTAPAVVPLASTSGDAVTQPSSTQSASGGFSLSFKAPATTTLASSSSQNVSQNTSVQFGSFTVQPTFSASASGTISSTSSGFTSSFGNSQQPSFRPVFGNSDSQQATPAFGSTAVPNFTGQPAKIPTTQPSGSNVLLTSGNQPTSSSVAGFTGLSAGANLFSSSAFPAGSSIFGGSVPKSDTQSSSGSFGSFTSVSAGGLFSSSTVPSASSLFGSSVTQTGGQTASSSFGAFPTTSAGSQTFGSSTGSNLFGSSTASKGNNQPGSNSFGMVNNPFGGAAPAFGSASIQQGSTIFGGSSGAVFNGKPSSTSTEQQSLPNGFHQSAGTASPFAFSAKSDQTPSGAASPFVFGQSTNTVNGFPVSTPVPNFGSSTPASSFMFGKLMVYNLS